MDRDTLRALARRNAELMLWASTAAWPDLGVAEPVGPLELALHGHAASVTTLAGASRAWRALDPTTWAALVDAAEAAVAEGDHPPAVDTAVSRRITRVTLRLGARLQGPATAVFDRSEFQPVGSLACGGWSTFLTMCADLCDPDDPGALSCWTHLLSAFALGGRLPLLETAMAVPVEAGRGVWGVPLTGAGWYLRLGQAQGTTGLYRVLPASDGAVVVAVSDGVEVARLVAPRGEAARWRGPLQAGYRSGGRGEVEVVVRDGAMTVRAAPGGAGVFLQRA